VELVPILRFSGKVKNMFCYIATNAPRINLDFPGGSTLPDPNRVLEGNGDSMRDVQICESAR
jgi:hypothetical protein